jgi:hypothetical protein
MIFQYRQIVKEKLLKLNENYDESTYNKYYLSGLTHIIPLIKHFAENVNDNFIDILFHKIYNETDSIEKIVNRGELEIVLYLSNTNFSLKNCQGFIIYTKTTHSVTKEEKIYVLLICIDKPYRKFGYGKVFMEEFIQDIKNTNTKSKRIILHSLDSCLNFYLGLGFTQVPDKITNYKKLFKFEKYDKESVLLHLEL